MNDLKFLKNNIYRETYYETTRKGKLFLKNDPRLVVGVQDLLLLLRGISVSYVQLRFFFIRFTSDTRQDLLENYAEKFLTAVLLDTLVRNLPLTIRNVFTDHNTFIFDICIEGANSAIRTILQELLLREPIAYVSRVEVHTKGEEEELFFLLEGRHNFEPSHSILPQYDIYDVIPPLPRQVPITLEDFDKFHQLLAQNYPIFYRDVKNRYCTIWCAQDGRGSYTVKRHVGGSKVAFSATFEEAEPLFQIERIVGVVPNLIPESIPYPQEIVIDLDIHNTVQYPIVKQVSDSFSEWLADLGLSFHRRLTGSLHGGQHFILPIRWTYPAILAGKIEVWEVYNRRSTKHILCDSARDAAELLCILFQVQNTTLATFCTTRIFHPYFRHKRILFDVGSNSMNRGRRALLSLHHNSLHVCVPLKTELPPTPEGLAELTSLDRLIESSGDLEEPSVTRTMQEQNTAILRELVERHEQLYHEFFTSNPYHFEELYCHLPINRIKVSNHFPSL